MNELTTTVLALMDHNRRETSGHRYTIPSPELYPFQWLWDSCFHAIILMRAGRTAEARSELISAFSKPLANGLIPHIVYWEDPKKFMNWGREHRGDVIDDAWGIHGTSSLTQPPLLATAALRVFETEPDEAFLKTIYPILKKHYLNLIDERRFDHREAGDALTYIVNPDESGEDNSPRFDRALGVPPIHTPDEHLDKRIELIHKNACSNFQPEICMQDHFGVADVPFNILYMEGLAALGTIAEIIGEHAAAIRFRLESEAVKTDIQGFLKHGALYKSYDFKNQEFIETKTWALFMPLYGGLVSNEEADELVNSYLLNEEFFKTPFLLPTTARSESSFDPDNGFWRGPVWMAPNWFIYKGLRRYGFDEVAEQIYRDSRALIEKSGFREQYNPFTGEGFGAEHFTWGGLVLDMD